jgi:oxygen-independent coproporphyrinogen-3 oxidase
VPTDPEANSAFGVYVHVPLCADRCDYCAFSIIVGRDDLVDSYVSACRTELARALAEEDLRPATSVYFGGGTPSRLPADSLLAVLDAVPRAEGAEVTVECNPEDADPGRLAALRSGGVTRLSLGVQSTVPHVLAALGRRHGAGEGLDAAAAVAAAGFDSWSVDLIFGAEAETDADWERTLTDVLELESPPPHVSAYALSIEPGTPLSRRSGRVDEGVQARRYQCTERFLSGVGHQWEEISNWAKPGHACRHNHLYWEQSDYRGIGPAAHSHRAGRRWRNVASTERYLERVRAGRSPTVAEEILGPAERELEALMLSLRTPKGVPEAYLPDSDDLADLVERDGATASLTVRGRLLADLVSSHLRVPAETRHARGAGAAVAPGTIPRDA